MKSKRIAAIVIGVLIVSGLVTGCTRVRLEDADGPEGSRSQSVSLEGADRVKVNLQMGAGELRITPGTAADELMDASFLYRPESWNPLVEYDRDGDVGELVVRHKESTGPTLGFGATRSRWDIALSKRVPLDLTVALGAGSADLDLRGLGLEEFDIQMGAGEAILDLSGERVRDLSGSVQAGVGELTIILPRGVGVRVNGRQDGMGPWEAVGFKEDGNAWVNDAYTTSDVTIEIDVQRGLGDVVLRFGD